MMAIPRLDSVLRVYVGGIGDSATEPELYAAFACVGVPLSHVELVVNRATGCLRGFAFVAVANGPAAGRASADVDDILSRMRLALVDGRPLTVQPIACELAPRPIRAPTAAEPAAGTSQRSGAGQGPRAATGQPA